jgi:hypothetical protein
MWINLKKYIGQEFEIEKNLMPFICIKKEITKKHDKDVGIPIWVVAIGLSGIPTPILLKFTTEKEALEVKEEIKNA